MFKDHVILTPKVIDLVLNEPLKLSAIQMQDNVI